MKKLFSLILCLACLIAGVLLGSKFSFVLDAGTVISSIGTLGLLGLAGLYQFVQSSRSSYEHLLILAKDCLSIPIQGYGLLQRAYLEKRVFLLPQARRDIERVMQTASKLQMHSVFLADVEKYHIVRDISIAKMAQHGNLDYLKSIAEKGIWFKPFSSAEEILHACRVVEESPPALAKFEEATKLIKSTAWADHQTAIWPELEAARKNHTKA